MQLICKVTMHNCVVGREIVLRGSFGPDSRRQ